MNIIYICLEKKIWLHDIILQPDFYLGKIIGQEKSNLKNLFATKGNCGFSISVLKYVKVYFNKVSEGSGSYSSNYLLRRKRQRNFCNNMKKRSVICNK